MKTTTVHVHKLVLKKRSIYRKNPFLTHSSGVHVQYWLTVSKWKSHFTNQSQIDMYNVHVLNTCTCTLHLYTV